MPIELDYHSHPEPSDHHVKALILWLDKTTDSQHEFTRTLKNMATDEMIPCTCNYMHIDRMPDIGHGEFLYIEYFKGPGWRYEERLTVKLDGYSRTSHLFYAYWTFDDEALLVMFKLIWHNWVTWDEVKPLWEAHPEHFKL